MLDNATVDYILNYFSSYMTLHEVADMKNYMGPQAKGLQVTKEHADECEQFRIRTATRLLNDNPGKVYLNLCPECKKLARTPYAKQCRFCGYSWHKQVAATFQIVSAFQFTGKGFCILGDILTGRIEIGMKVDLTTLGLAIKPVIMDIGFALHREAGTTWEDAGLTISDIPEEDKAFIKSNSPFRTPVFIEALLTEE